MKHLKIVPKDLAVFLLPRIVTADSVCYYFNEDVSHFLYLRDKFAGQINIKNLSELFDETFQKLKIPLINLISKLNKDYDSLEWWGGQIASRNSASTPLLLNITYLFCARKILCDSKVDLIFVVDSQALYDCISASASELGYQVKRCGKIYLKFTKTTGRYLLYIAKIVYFFLKSVQSRKAAFKFLKPLPIKKKSVGKRVVIRSWVTKGAFDGSGKFSNRNFGQLPVWLHKKNYEVLNLPMFFNLSETVKGMYVNIKNQEQAFLIPDHYLRFSDYLKVLYDNYKLLRKQIGHAVIEHINVAPIFNEVLRDQGFNPNLSILNLCYPMLNRLKGRGYEFNSFYYPFENNAPEKQFILGCRKYFPNSEIIGFQHTTFFPNQLAYHLGPEEKDYHPLPDKIVCSGPIYVKLHNEAGFPSEVLVAGPNLRFESVYEEKAEVMNNGDNNTKIHHLISSNFERTGVCCRFSFTSSQVKNNNFHRKFRRLEKLVVDSGNTRMLLLPLTFSYDLAFELFVKTNEALEDISDYRVYIRSHPLLSKKILIKFLNQINMKNYEFANDGIIQDWLFKSYAVLSTGASITILEAVSMGTPVIRVIPDNTFFYDPFTWPNYPLEPINSSSEIRKQLELIDEIQVKDKLTFNNIAREARLHYFTKPNEENLKLFL